MDRLLTGFDEWMGVRVSDLLQSRNFGEKQCWRFLSKQQVLPTSGKATKQIRWDMHQGIILGQGPS